MESIGDKLRTERELKNLTVEQIARDTNIAKRYLEALEIEDFSVFPGDPYLIGFLRNYAEYLGIDPEEMVTLYRNFTIQSQPVPMDELLDRKRSGKPWLILAIVIVVIGLGFGGYFLFPVIFDRSESDEPAPSRESTHYVLETTLERRLFAGDTVAVTVEDEEYTLGVASISDALTLDVPGGTNVLRIGDERAIDLDGDAAMDIRIEMTDIDTGSDPRSAVVRIDRFTGNPGLGAANAGTSGVGTAGTAGNSGNSESEPVLEPADVGLPSLTSREIPPVDIRRESNAEAFRVSVVFRGNCLFRFLIDGDDREERYYQRGETLELDVGREIRLWVSNAGNVIVRINGTELQLGSPGEVSTRMIGWQADESGGGSVLRMVAMY